MGIVLGAKVTFMEFVVNNLIPVTIGNTIAGVCIVAFSYSCMHGSLLAPKPATAA
jgi:formate/nitrite transporter FocA (FNT family)